MIRQTQEAKVLEPIELARYVVGLIEDRKGEDILLLDLRGVSIIADFFVICSAPTQRQLKAIAEVIAAETKKAHGLLPYHVEGEAAHGWVLIDYSAVVIHAFSPEKRGYYDLEGLWRDAAVLVSIQ
jgi:ribosome-associated protein